MTLKPLLLGILGVVAVTTGSYFVLSPYVERIASQSEDINVESVTDVYERESQTVVQVEDVAELLEYEQDDEDVEEVAALVPAQLEPEPAKVATKAEPVPAATVAPVPAEPAISTPSGYTLAVIAAHNSKASCWTTVNGSVYDITPYVPKHPGGEKNILKICGKDGTSAFEGQHGGESKPENILVKYRIGALI